MPVALEIELTRHRWTWDWCVRQTAQGRTVAASVLPRRSEASARRAAERAARRVQDEKEPRRKVNYPYLP